jgi:outer membrane murein-binding lipoprotein Lpp
MTAILAAWQSQQLLKIKIPAVVLMLSACASRGDIEALDSRVSTLENQVTTAQNRASAAEARASQLETAANQCTSSCQSARVSADRAYQSMPKK